MIPGTGWRLKLSASLFILNTMGKLITSFQAILISGKELIIMPLAAEILSTG